MQGSPESPAVNGIHKPNEDISAAGGSGNTGVKRHFHQNLRKVRPESLPTPLPPPLKYISNQNYNTDFKDNWATDLTESLLLIFFGWALLDTGNTKANRQTWSLSPLWAVSAYSRHAARHATGSGGGELQRHPKGAPHPSLGVEETLPSMWLTVNTDRKIKWENISQIKREVRARGKQQVTCGTSRWLSTRAPVVTQTITSYSEFVLILSTRRNHQHVLSRRLLWLKSDF